MTIDFGLWTDLSLIERKFTELARIEDGFGFDIETGYSGPPREKFSLHPETAFIAGMSVSGDHGWARYIPLAHIRATNNVDSKKFAHLLAKLLGSGKAISHNATFELRHVSKFLRERLTEQELLGYGLSAYGHFPIFSDSMIESYLLGQFRNNSLKSLAWDVFRHRMIELSALFPGLTEKQLKSLRFSELELTPAAISYACDDAAQCLGLSRRHRPLVEGRLLYRVEMALIPILAEMEDYGVAFDWTRMARVLVEAERFSEAQRRGIMQDLSQQLDKPVDINLGSTPQVSDILYSQLGLKTTRLTKTGKMSTDDKALAGLAKKHRVVRRIQDFREIRKLIDSYLEKYPRDFNYAADGRTHSSHNQVRVVSGRFSVSEPGYQQQPKRYDYSLDSGEEFHLNFRDFITAAPKHYLIGFDYCLAPQTRVLTSDLRWVSLRDVPVGEKLIGFDEEFSYSGGLKGRGSKRTQRMRETVVEAKRDVCLPSYLITLEDGTQFTASDDHYWVATDKNARRTPREREGTGYGVRRKWWKTSELTPHHHLHKWVDPWPDPETLSVEDRLDLAYLSGFADGEGWITSNTVGLGQAPGPVWTAVLERVHRLGFPLGTHDVSKAGTERIHMQGGNTALRFLGMTRPARLMQDARDKFMWEGTSTYSRSTNGAGGLRVVSVERCSEPQDLIALRTSTGTFLAEGFLTHNSQIELRVLAALSREPALLRAYEKGDDVHALTAALLFNIPLSDVTDEQRGSGKTFNFATSYQQGVKALAESLGTSLERAQGLQDQFFASYPAVRKWTQRQVQLGVERGYTTSIFGRRHPLWELESDSGRIRSTGERLCVNAPIQGNAADICKIAMVRADKGLAREGLKDRVHLIMNIHDALYYEVHESVAPQTVIDVVHPEVVFDIPEWPCIEVEWSLGRRWGSMVKLKLDAGNRIVVPQRADLGHSG